MFYFFLNKGWNIPSEKVEPPAVVLSHAVCSDISDHVVPTLAVKSALVHLKAFWHGHADFHKRLLQICVHQIAHSYQMFLATLAQRR